MRVGSPVHSSRGVSRGPSGAKARVIVALNAALKRRSSTVLLAAVALPQINKQWRFFNRK